MLHGPGGKRDWLTRRLSVYAYGQPCDMRKSFDALCELVTQALGETSCRILEGSELVGRERLSPEPYTLAPLFQPQAAAAVTS